MTQQPTRRKTRIQCAIDAPCPNTYLARHADSPPLPLDHHQHNTMSDTTKTADDTVTAPVIDLIPASQFERYPTNRNPHPDAVKSMTVSIREVGVIQPILARPVDDGAGGMRLQVIFGETRWRGCQAIDPNYPVPTRIRQLDDRDAAKIHAIENFQRKDLDDIEAAREIKHLLDVGWNFDEVQGHVGYAKDWLYRRLALLKLPEQGQLAIIEGNLTLQTAGKIVGLPEEMRERAIKAVVEPTHAARALPERDALQIIERDFVKPWEAEQAWNEKRKLVEKENPGAKWLPYKEAVAAGRWDSDYEPADARPSWQHLSEAARNDEMAVPTWGELAQKHGMEIRIGLDGSCNTTLYVIAEALIDAEKTAHEDSPLDCIFRFPDQSGAAQEAEANDRARRQAEADAQRKAFAEESLRLGKMILFDQTTKTAAKKLAEMAYEDAIEMGFLGRDNISRLLDIEWDRQNHDSDRALDAAAIKLMRSKDMSPFEVFGRMVFAERCSGYASNLDVASWAFDSGAVKPEAFPIYHGIYQEILKQREEAAAKLETDEA